MYLVSTTKVKVVFTTFKSDYNIKVKYFFFSATVLVSEVLPRAQNRFPGCQLHERRLHRWNQDASKVNQLLREMAIETQWMKVIGQTDFHTHFGTTILL